MARREISDYFGKVLKKARLNSGLSQEELALESGLDMTYVSMLERGIKNPTLTTIAKLSSALNLTSVQLVSRMHQLETGSGAPKMNRKPQAINLFATTVSCGKPFGGEFSVDKILSLDELLIKNPAETFFVKASGDSMSPIITDGDYLIIQKDLKPKNGSIILAQVDNEFTVKRFYKSSKGIRLIPENPSFKEILVTSTAQFWPCGVVVGVAKSL
jgi:DNA polymerase V